MAIAIIKEEYKNKRIGFGKSADPLSQRTGTEIDLLALAARQSNNPELIKLFKHLPTLEELKKAKTESELKRPVVVDVKPSPIIQ